MGDQNAPERIKVVVGESGRPVAIHRGLPLLYGSALGEVVDAAAYDRAITERDEARIEREQFREGLARCQREAQDLVEFTKDALNARSPALVEGEQPAGERTTEYRVRYDRTDRRHGRRGEDVRACGSLEDAEAVARHQKRLDVEGVRGLGPVANPLTFGPVIERREVTAWVVATGEANACENEATCRRCGGQNIEWSAPSPLWNAVMRGGSINGPWQFNEIICPTCFALLAEGSGIASGWRFYATDVHVELETVTPSGRTWNPETWLWEDPAAGEQSPRTSMPREARQAAIQLAVKTVRSGSGWVSRAGEQSTTETATGDETAVDPIADGGWGDAPLLEPDAAPATPEGPEPTLSLAMEVRLVEELTGDVPPADDATPEGPDA